MRCSLLVPGMYRLFLNTNIHLSEFLGKAIFSEIALWCSYQASPQHTYAGMWRENQKSIVV